MSNSNIPLYSQIKEYIIEKINQDNWKPREQIPSQRVLATEQGVSHMTARRAINELLNEGVLYSIPGKGIYVSELDKQQAETGLFVSFTDDMHSRGMTASSKVLQFEIVYASTTLAAIFDCQLGFPLYILRRLRLANSQPIAIQTVYLDTTQLPNLLAYDFTNASLYTIIREKYQIMLSNGETSVQASIADDEQATLLDLQQPAPILVTEQITRNSNEKVIEFVRSVYSGERYKMQLHRHDTQLFK